MTESTISTLEQQVRDHINRARKQYALLHNSGAWNQLCSSLDVVGDTELAFDAYSAAPASDDAGTPATHRSSLSRAAHPVLIHRAAEVRRMAATFLME